MWQRAGRDWESIEKPKNHKTAKIQKVREISQRAGFAEEIAPKKSKDLKALKADFFAKNANIQPKQSKEKCPIW